MKNTSQEIDSVLTLVEVIAALPRARRRLYRGQPVDAPLLPRFAREAMTHALSDPLTAERQLLQDFRSLSVPYLGPVRPQDTYEWLAVAQHHGLPTRLLDWTGNPLAALWFVVRRGLKQGEKLGTLWTLDLQDHHQIPVFEDRLDIFELQNTRVFRPNHVTRRIVAQDGWFTAHWYVESKSKFIPLERQPRYSPNLRKYPVPRSNVKGIRKDLQALGLSDAVLFPELATICGELANSLFPSGRKLNGK